MIQNYPHTVTARFLRYVQIDTQSSESSETFPSTEKQKDLSRLLVNELTQMGIADAELDAHGYVYATIPANSEKEVPVICLCAHVDTAPDCSGKDVKPIVHAHWDGSDIVLPDDPSIVISKQEYPYLADKIGDTIITASGQTLLGADDKAGVAVIMDLAQYLIQNPQVKHGKIRLLFNPDEEVGGGVDHLDIEKLGADVGYTLDGSDRGLLEGETFAADKMTITFQGVSVHPGDGKSGLVSAIKAASHFLYHLPKELSPEATEERQGFVHPEAVEGGIESTEVVMLIRDFEADQLKQHEQVLCDLLKETERAFPGLTTRVDVTEQYRNMKEILDQAPKVMDYAEEAYRRAGLTVKRGIIRGGTDGSDLSFMGVPCSNLFVGEMAIHGKKEHVVESDMKKSVAMLVELVQVWEEKAPPSVFCQP